MANDDRPDDAAHRRTQAWYERYGEAVYRRCLRILQSEPAAWDATQEVFLRAFRAQDRLRLEGSAYSWLLTTADRHCCSVLGKNRRRSTLAPMVPLPPTDLRDPRTFEALLLESDWLSRLLAHFSEDIQRIVILRFVDELEHEEIAVQLRISRKTVHRRLERFFAHARELLSRSQQEADA